MHKQAQVSIVKEFRQKAAEQDTQELKDKRKDWIRKLLAYFCDNKTIFRDSKWGKIIDYNPQLEFREMYKTEQGEVIKLKPQDVQYFNDRINTRTKVLTETRAEIDKLPFEQAWNVCLEIIKVLLNKGYHFAVFYAEGQRSPHIIIYDFEELRELTLKQRYNAQMQFWKSIIPFFFQHLDYSVFHDNHLLPLEFSIHYRTGTPFKLVIEWLPEPKKIVEKKQVEFKEPEVYNEPEKLPFCCDREMAFLKYKDSTTKVILCSLCGKQEEIKCST